MRKEDDVPEESNVPFLESIEPELIRFGCERLVCSCVTISDEVVEFEDEYGDEDEDEDDDDDEDPSEMLVTSRHKTKVFPNLAMGAFGFSSGMSRSGLPSSSASLS